MKFISLFSLFISASVVLSCEDGVDNILHIYDTMNGKGVVQFDDVQILTYTSNREPSCEEGKGVWQFPGFFRFKSGTVTVSKAVSESNGQITLDITLSKNSFIVGEVCRNGKSKNSFVPNEMCSFPICKIATDKCKMLENTGEYDLVEETKSQGDNGLIDMGPMPVPQLSGEWSLEVVVKQGKNKLAGLKAQKDGEWLNVSAEEVDLSNVKKTTYPAGSPPPAHSEL